MTLPRATRTRQSDHTMKLSDNIFTRLSKPITVYISLESFRIETEHKSITLQTYLYVAYQNNTLTVASVGEEPEDKTHTERVDLFTGQSRFDKYDILVAFLKHAISQVVSKRAMIRPTIHCYGSKHLGSVMNGYEAGILTRAFEEVGAMLIYIK